MSAKKSLQHSVLPLASLAFITASPAFAGDYHTCLLQQLELAKPDATVASIKAICSEAVDSQPSLVESTLSVENTESTADEMTVPTPFEERLAVETQTRNELFVITPHKSNYVLPWSYNNNPNWKPFKSQRIPYDKTEVKFQISLKAAVAKNLFLEHGDLYVAYTNQSWWQAYNSDVSSPFRETNHEPEIFYGLPTDFDLFGMKVRALQLGLNHQSNGRSGDMSRSWNRLYVAMLLEKDNFYIHLKPWWRIPEDKKKSPTDADGDDNPDITKYLGYGELSMFYKLGEHNINMMLRNNLRSDNKGAVQLGWSFPLSKRNKLRGYVQYFNGYGESLIDYNASVSRLSVGIMLTDFL